MKRQSGCLSTMVIMSSIGDDKGGGLVKKRLLFLFTLVPV